MKELLGVAAVILAFAIGTGGPLVFHEWQVQKCVESMKDKSTADIQTLCKTSGK